MADRVQTVDSAQSLVAVFFNTVKEHWNSFSLKDWSEKVAGESAQAVQAAIYFAGAFVIGFFLKKHLKLILMAIIFSVIVIKTMEYNALLMINWEAAKTFVGLAPTADLNSLIGSFIGWVKGHILLSLATFVGFLIGYKLG